jgi:uncharacterized membrane protein
MPDAAAFCPGCGQSMNSEMETTDSMNSETMVSQDVASETDQDAVVEEVLIERAHGNVGPLPRTIAGALAYCTIFPAIFFLLVEPFKQDRFVRFHSYQCIALYIVAAVLAVALRLGGILLSLIPMVGPLLVVLLWMVAGLGLLTLWMVLIVKALQGERFQLPLLGGMAERFATK